MNKIKKAWPILASVLLLALAFPPFNLSLLVFVAVAPWLASLRDTDAKGAVKSSALFGFLYILFQMFWLIPFVTDWTKKPVMALIPWLVCGFLGCLLYLPMGWLINFCWRKKWPWLIPLVWAGHEGFRAYVPVLAFPWGILANPLWQFPQFVQHAAIGTVFMVSAWLMIPNIVAAMLIWPEKNEKGENAPAGSTLLRWSLVFAGVMIVSVFHFSQAPTGTKKTITLGQPGVDMAFTPKDIRALDLKSVGNLIQSKATNQHTDLLVFPEGFSQTDPREFPFSPVGEKPLLPTIMGGRRADGEKTYQTAFAYDGKWSFADKTRLVVFGEYVPFRDLPLLSGFHLPAGDLDPGPDLKTVDVNGMRLGPLLCFEGVFPDLADRHGRLGAQLLVQMSIDDWYEKTPAWEQLWQSSIWRSIESGLPLVRVGGRGQSLATNARGEIVMMIPKGQMAAEPVELLVPSKSDSFSYRMGFVYLCWAVCGVLICLMIADRMRRSEPK